MKCNHCGNENRNDSDFCVYCGARLTRENKHNNKHKNKRHRRNVWAIRVLVVAVILLCGIAVGVSIGKGVSKKKDKDETLYGRRVRWEMGSRRLPFSKNNVPLAYNSFDQGQRNLWSPEWVSVTGDDLCYAGGRIFSYSSTKIEVYDEDLKLIRQLSDYDIMQAYTNGSKVYMIILGLGDGDYNNHFACWDVDRDEFVFIQMIQMWPSMPMVSLAGANREGVFYYTADPGGTSAHWFMYSFDTERVLDLGIFEGALDYVGDSFYLAKVVPFDVDWVPYASGTLYYVQSDRQTRMKISNSATVSRVYEHMVYYLEESGNGGVFKCFNIDTQESRVLSDPVKLSWQSDFMLLRGGLGAVFNNNPSYDEDIGRKVDFYNFKDGSVNETYTEEPFWYYGGYNGYVSDKTRQNIYRYKPFEPGLSLYYSAPQGWAVRGLLEVGKSDVYVKLINTADYTEQKLVKAGEVF